MPRAKTAMGTATKAPSFSTSLPVGLRMSFAAVLVKRCSIFGPMKLNHARCISDRSTSWAVEPIEEMGDVMALSAPFPKTCIR